MNTASTLRYHPWLAAAILTFGLAAGLISFSTGKKRCSKAAKQDI
ncbi:hypothetical protein [Brevibacillus massiliensis]|nr:hypothetical protein [Brevibacillus massiliensis]